MQLHSACENARFNVATDGGHFFRRMGVRRALDCLRDNWAFIEISGYIVRRRANQFDAAVERLRVGRCAFETRQE